VIIQKEERNLTVWDQVSDPVGRCEARL